MIAPQMSLPSQTQMMENTHVNLGTNRKHTWLFVNNWKTEMLICKQWQTDISMSCKNVPFYMYFLWKI